MELLDKRVLVIGSGISGIGAVKLLWQVGARPVLFDSNKKITKQAVLDKMPEGIEADVVIGKLPLEILDEICLAVISPGVSLEQDFVQDIRERQIPVWGELELAYAYAKGKLIAITGTNGKTTTTELIGKLMEAYYSSVYVVGNIGNPFTEIALSTTDDTISVAEVSSFQLETIENFAPDISLILNITPDHLDRHHTMKCYVNMKKRVLINQSKNQVCILNYDDAYTRKIGEAAKVQVIFFSTKEKLQNGIWLDGEFIVESRYGIHNRIMNIHDMKLVGMCNVENVMAAIAAAEVMKIPMNTIKSVVKDFNPIEHRIEYVAAKGGIDFYNDSKGTNPDAAIQAIKAMTKPTVLIGGGYKKDSQYDEWIQSFEGKVKAFVLIGDTKNDIADCAYKYGIENVIMADTFEEAFAICMEQAKEGDAVLLSPACASWGMFKDYKERGNLFKSLVHSLDI